MCLVNKNSTYCSRFPFSNICYSAVLAGQR
uniref:Uncharacterized protein n=1 Tax=Anguilla anguilla TaxID=7936 RepID=A0A0E9QL06_ANGAN